MERKKKILSNQNVPNRPAEKPCRMPGNFCWDLATAPARHTICLLLASPNNWQVRGMNNGKLTVGTAQVRLSVVLPCGVHSSVFACCLEDGEKVSLDKSRYPPGVVDRTHGGLSAVDRAGDESVATQLCVRGTRDPLSPHHLLLYSGCREQRSPWRTKP